MLYPALRVAPRLQSRRIAVWHRCGVATATPKHPNPGNFANRPREEMSEIGHRGGKKGGKVRGIGGFHDMDPEKQHSIASRGGRATRKASKELAEDATQAKASNWTRYS
ncbi:Conidiation-specific protein 10 [Penicillium brasilianum]|uniref:Conidiation-specific protein 10 n=1 Tax=Penicillium brasilianum TaxID=104259 RepID=A0A1S9RJ61_PENBI|nr:Conidiation-specific protein 10 [Penicillium brasilianum]